MALATRSPLRLTFLALLAFALAAPAAKARAAGVPSPGNSTVPACLISAPNGFASTMIVVRDLANNPLINSFVVIQYGLCTEFNPCPALVTDDYLLDLPGQSMRRLTNAQGQAEFHVRAGGGCSGNNIRVFADGVLLANIRSASVDQNGDHSVDAADIALHETRQGTLDYRGDLNCDWMVNEDDEFIIGGALGTNCLDPTPNRRSTWGQVKIRYR